MKTLALTDFADYLTAKETKDLPLNEIFKSVQNSKKNNNLDIEIYVIFFQELLLSLLRLKKNIFYSCKYFTV